jgi:hypothetical protein
MAVKSPPTKPATEAWRIRAAATFHNTGIGIGKLYIETRGFGPQAAVSRLTDPIKPRLPERLLAMVQSGSDPEAIQYRPQFIVYRQAFRLGTSCTPSQHSRFFRHFGHSVLHFGHGCCQWWLPREHSASVPEQTSPAGPPPLLVAPRCPRWATGAPCCARQGEAGDTCQEVAQDRQEAHSTLAAPGRVLIA